MLTAGRTQGCPAGGAVLRPDPSTGSMAGPVDPFPSPPTPAIDFDATDIAVGGDRVVVSGTNGLVGELASFSASARLPLLGSVGRWGRVAAVSVAVAAGLGLLWVWRRRRRRTGELTPP